MEAIIKIAEIKEFKFAGGEKTGWNIIDGNSGEVYSTFSDTVKSEAEAGLLDEKPRKIEYTEKPNTNPDYPPKKTISRMANAEGNMPEIKRSGGGGFAKADPVKQASIERQNAMNNAVQLYIAFKVKKESDRLDMKSIKELAQELLDWTQEGKIK